MARHPLLFILLTGLGLHTRSTTARWLDRVDEGAPHSIATVVLGAVELLAQLGLVVLRDCLALLELMLSMRKSTLKQRYQSKFS